MRVHSLIGKNASGLYRCHSKHKETKDSTFRHTLRFALKKKNNRENQIQKDSYNINIKHEPKRPS
jgi:hypothetical protein